MGSAPVDCGWCRRGLTALGFGAAGAALGGGIALVLGACTTCGTGRDPLFFAALLGLVATASAWNALGPD